MSKSSLTSVTKILADDVYEREERTWIDVKKIRRQRAHPLLQSFEPLPLPGRYNRYRPLQTSSRYPARFVHARHSSPTSAERAAMKRRRPVAGRLRTGSSGAYTHRRRLPLPLPRCHTDPSHPRTRTRRDRNGHYTTMPCAGQDVGSLTIRDEMITARSGQRAKTRQTRPGRPAGGGAVPHRRGRADLQPARSGPQQVLDAAELTLAIGQFFASYGLNTRDFRCLWRSGLLPLSCSVSVFESGCGVPPRECGHGFGPRVAAGTARGSTVRGPGGRGGFSFLTVPASAAGL